MDELLKTLATNSVFALMLVIVWKQMLDVMQKKDGAIEKKDLELRELHDKVLKAFTENTVATHQTNQVVDNNTKAVEQLTDRIYKILTEHV